MISKESIKQVVSSDISIQFPYKSSISSWYGELKLYKLNDFYYVGPFNIKFFDVDDAVNYFCNEAFTSKNVGYIQSRLIDKGILDMDDSYSLEHPNKKVKNLFKEEAKLVDEEAKSLNITVKEFPKPEIAISEFQSIIDNFNVDTIKDELLSFDRKYSTLDPYISLSYKYDVEGSEYGYRTTFDYGGFSKKEMKKAKNRKDLPQHKMTWKCLEITLRVRGDEEFYRHEVKV